MNKKTQNEMVLELLKKGPVTALEIFKKTGSMCAAERVRDLRAKGYNIITNMIDLPNGKRVGKYFLITAKRKAA
jgi:hypothetical protein